MQPVKIAFASCAKLQSLAVQPGWSDIEAASPDVLLLLGDTVYLDRNDHDDPTELAADLCERFREQFAEPSFGSLLADLSRRGGCLVAIYDDHDFLGNNRCGGDAAPALREAARREFAAAFGAVSGAVDGLGFSESRPQVIGSNDHPTRPSNKHPNELYALHRLGLVDLILLDARYHRQPASASADDPNAVLGATQWHWFESVFSASTARYIAIATSSTLHDFVDESWERYPAAFKRMLSLVRPRAGAFVVSGDIHRNAVYDDFGVIEIVSSGVAQRGLLTGAERRNWGLLRFSREAMHVELHSLKIGSRMSFEVPWDDWRLP